MSQHFAQEIIPLTSILSHKGRGSKVNDWRSRSRKGMRKQGWAMTGDVDPPRGEEAKLGNDWRCRIAKSTLSIHAIFLKKPSTIESKMQLGKKSY